MNGELMVLAETDENCEVRVKSVNLDVTSLTLLVSRGHQEVEDVTKLITCGRCGVLLSLWGGGIGQISDMW